MDQDVKTKWVAALRSGEYAQAQHKLRTANGFCCLGVLCDLYSKEHPEVVWKDDGMHGGEVHFAFDGQISGPSMKVGEWAKLRRVGSSYNPDVVIDDLDSQEQKRVTNLMDLNDQEGWDFKKIADVIEAQL